MNKLLNVISKEAISMKKVPPLDAQAVQRAAEMLEDVAQRGEAAVREYAASFGDCPLDAPCFFGRDQLQDALERSDPSERAVLERTAKRVGNFARAQRSSVREFDIEVHGARAGQAIVPVRVAGCYAPGGRFALPSSVIMTAVTARAAGVECVWVASPRPTIATLAAAAIAGADGLLAIGGVQAIGALAHGLCGVSACDVIVGPGNKWVTAAKWLLSHRVGIDMLAGPSELLVLADSSANPAIIAADLLAQAEHDCDAVPMLVTTDPTLPHRVEQELAGQLETLPTRETALAAMNNGFAIVAKSLDEAIEITNELAPEHLEVMTTNATEVAACVRHAGAVFIGSACAEVLGDYGAGPNHVLPTGGTARFRAGLSVFTFLRMRTWMRIDEPIAAEALARDAAALARLERLEAHARSAEARTRKSGISASIS